MKWNILFLIILAFGSSHFVIGQASQDFMSFKNFNPPSPEMSLFQRYGDIPVNLSSGIPSIDIPLFDIKSGQLSLPLSLSYHASGIKTEDMSSPVGLGWVLNAGGAVSRNVIGFRDEYPDIGFLNLDNFITRAMIQSDHDFDGDEKLLYLTNLAEGNRDSQSDEYYINMPGLSCRFLYDISKVIHYDAPDRQIIIDRDLTSDRFIITDDAGTRYFFEKKEYTSSVENGYTDPTAWMLTKLLSSDGVDSIVFKYINANQYSDYYVSHQYIIRDVISESTFHDNCYTTAFESKIITSLSHIVYDRVLLDSIIFKSGKIKLEYLSDRQDPVDERLTGITLFSNEGPVKKIDFIQSYFVSNSPGSGRYNNRLRLDRVDFCNVQADVLNSYKFEYNPVGLPAYRFYDGVNLYKTIEYDHWGYYNNNQAYIRDNKTLIPDNLEIDIKRYITTLGKKHENHYPVIQQYYLWASNRNPDDYYASACILKKITYPAGGYSIFEFEGNKANNSSVIAVGGNRIKGISDFDSKGIIQAEKTYVYGEGDGAGLNITPPLPYTFSYSRPTIIQKFCSSFPSLLVINVASQDFVASSSSVVPINFFNGSPVFYYIVKEYDGNILTNNGSTIYTYEYDTDKLFGYPVTKYGGFRTNRNWIRGQLLTSRIFDSRNVLKREIKNFYTTKGLKTIKTGFICERTTDVNVELQTFLSQTIPVNEKNLLTYFDYIDVDYDLGVKLLTRTEEYDYIQGAVVKQTDYFYESPYHLYTSKKEIKQSDSSIIIENYKYPEDKAEIQGLGTDGLNAINNLITKNILNPTIEKSIFNGSKILERDLYEYKVFSPHLIKVGHKKRQIGTGQIVTEYTFNYDIYGNVIEQYKENDLKTTVIWGYDHQLPVANIDGASLVEVQAALGGAIPDLGRGGLTETQISTLRTELPAAMISAFTYRPLVGLTSQTGPDGVTTYYEYDSFGRVVKTKDNDGRILRTYEYHYGQ